MTGIVVIGAGHAGVQLADSLRAGGYSGRLSILSAENEMPYQRPPLSKDYLTGDDPQPLPLRGPDFYRERDVDLRVGTAVTEIDRHGRRLECADGTTLAYTELVIATGSRNRVLDIPGAHGSGVHYLRNTTDATDLHSELGRAATAVVVGAGFIGLEFAAAATRRGIAVTVVEAGPRPLLRALTEPTTERLIAEHQRAGVNFRFGSTVAEIERSDHRVTAVICSDDERIAADLVVVGIGAEPVTELGSASGLHIGNGIYVDEYLRTTDEHVWAIGDCAEFPCVHARARVRRESVQNAADQARTLARTLTGTPAVYQDLPWFWSHQGACKIQIAGAGGEVDRTVIPADSGSKFSTWCFREDVLVAVESVNQPAVHSAARKLLSGPRKPTYSELADAEFDLRRMVRPQGAFA
ncbi:FAD-dependent oxidoreductase [Nocardia sp. NPDC019395]|uniref:NAD(P)/FAD-dependent oxidoreductase n=1 Tax=Nocardia sp. NPDC019395 TaxID=3154686 RepID=UPI00340F6CA7